MIDPEAIQRNHEALSPAFRDILLFVQEHPEEDWSIDYQTANIPEFMRDHPFPLQPLPTFVGGEKLAEIQRVTVGIPELLKAIPERVFEFDAKRMANFYGFSDVDLVSLILTRPNSMETLISRGDFVETEKGFLCLEANVGACVGGWQARFWEKMYYEKPIFNQFLLESGLMPTWRDPLEMLFQLVIEDCTSKSLGGRGELNVVFIILEGSSGNIPIERYFNQVYGRILHKVNRRLVGKVIFSEYEEGFHERGGCFYCGNFRVDAVVEYTASFVPQAVLRAYKVGKIGLFNGPIDHLLNSKRNLALLSELEESELFIKEEQQLIQDHIPWSRYVQEGSVRYLGEMVDLKKLLLGKQRDFVIKHVRGSQGRDVFVGCCLDPEIWREVVEQAIAGGSWLVQEYLQSLTYLYRYQTANILPSDLVWGTFSMGSRFGGAFLRMMPRDNNDGVINSSTGATEGFIFEV